LIADIDNSTLIIRVVKAMVKLMIAVAAKN